MGIKLYSANASGNSYKARLLLALLGKKYELVDMNMGAGAHKEKSFLAINPRGQVPALQDGKVTLWDSTAILVYLAQKYGGKKWLPTDAAGAARVMQWMAVSQNECLYGMARARAVVVMKRPWNMDEVQTHGRAGLALLDAHLKKNKWLAGSRPTIADIASFPYVALAPMGEISLEPYANVRAWIGRIKALPGFVGMPGIEAPAKAAKPVAKKTVAKKAAAKKPAVRKSAAKRTVAKKATAKKATPMRAAAAMAAKPATKTAATKKPAPKKVAAKKPAATKAAPKKAAATKPAAKKAPVKKTPVKKAAAKKPAAKATKAAAPKKAAVKPPAAKKAAAPKKAAAKKPAAKKAPAKKPAAKKPAAKPAAR